MRICFAILFLFSAYLLSAQTLKISESLRLSLGAGQINQWEELLCENEACTEKVNAIRNELINRGYLQANVYQEKEGKWMVIKEGALFRYGEIVLENLPAELLNDISSILSKGKVFEKIKLDSLSDELLKFFENNGYPFAELEFTPGFVVPGLITGKLTLEKGPKVVFGKVFFNSKDMAGTWLTDKAGIQKGELYQKELTKKIPELLKNTGYADDCQIRIVIKNQKADIYIVSTDKLVSTADGMLGFFYDEAVQKLILTGYLSLKFDNVFKKPGYFEFNWDRLRPESQKMNFRLWQTSMWGGAWSAGLDMDLLKVDSSFFNWQTGAELRYSIRDKLGFSILLSSDFNHIDPDKAIVGNELVYADQEAFYMGLGIQNVFGQVVNITEIRMGRKKINAISSMIDGFLPEKQNGNRQFIFNLEGEWETKLTKQSKYFLNWRGGYIIGEQLYRNDYFRLGGVQSLRGYSEQEFFVPSYLIGRQEFRFGMQNYFYLLSDWSWLATEKGNGIYGSAGIGLKATAGKEGIFDFVLAIPKRTGQSFNFSETVVHVGYLVKF